jgi:hypothetical protein
MTLGKNKPIPFGIVGSSHAKLTLEKNGDNVGYGERRAYVTDIGSFGFFDDDLPNLLRGNGLTATHYLDGAFGHDLDNSGNEFQPLLLGGHLTILVQAGQLQMFAKLDRIFRPDSWLFSG